MIPILLPTKLASGFNGIISYYIHKAMQVNVHKEEKIIHKRKTVIRHYIFSVFNFTNEFERKTGESSSVVGLRPGGIVR